MVETQNMALLVIAVLVVAVLAVVVMRGSPAGQLAIPGDKQTCYWTTVYGSFIIDNVVETAVGSCTWRDDNYDIFDKGTCTVDGTTDYRDTCIDGNPDINMREYSCKYVTVGGVTTDYLVTTEGTCTLGCKGGSGGLSLDVLTPTDSCIESKRVRVCSSTTVTEIQDAVF